MRALALFVLFSLACVSARAQDERALPQIGARGRNLVDGVLAGSWSNNRDPDRFYHSFRASVSLVPSWVYFVRDGIGLGLYVGYRYRKSEYDPVRPGGATNVLANFHYHEFSVGVTTALELFASGRVSLYARPYFGYSLRRRRYDESALEGPVLAPSFAPSSDHLAEAGIRLPLLYQVNANLGFGLGPEFHWQHLSEGFRSLRAGFGTWIARSF